MMDASAIQQIGDMAEGAGRVEEHGTQSTLFHVCAKSATPLKFPEAETVKLFSLNQIVSYLKTLMNARPADGETEPGKAIINVLDHENVEIIDEGYNENMNVSRLAVATMEEMFSPFPFGQKMSQEDFIINVMTKFVQNDVTAELLKLVSSIKEDAGRVSDDDGYSQVVNTKQGVTLVSESKLKNLWILQTYKTFPEVEQPLIPYVLRLHDGGRLALYDSDGGAWKVNVTKTVREYLVNRIKGELGEKAEMVTVL
jgi:hypothetical protein